MLYLTSDDFPICTPSHGTSFIWLLTTHPFVHSRTIWGHRVSITLLADERRWRSRLFLDFTVTSGI